MFIELEPIFNNEGAEKQFELALVLDDCDANAIAKVKGVVSNKNSVVTLTADLDYVLKSTCDRCATDVSLPIKVKSEHTLVLTLNDEDNDDFIIVEDMHFLLDDLLREDILLVLPTKVLCREDCKGLCPYCGTDLNQKKCDCEKPIDPRLAALKQLLDE
ncbi:MAG: DUF177 domain-containing protein [Oscillospiraceae bacterium]